MNNDKPKSIWKKSWKGPRLFLVWLALVLAALVLFSIGVLISGKPFTEHSDYRVVLIGGVVTASLLFVFWLFIRWLCCWRNFKRFLFGLACFVTLIALFYAEEDWRGKHDWDQFKRQWEAKGEKFDYASIIPPPVPDDQNFAMAPIFGAVDKLMNWQWRAEHKNPHFGKNGDQRPWDTNMVDRLDMNVTYDYEPPPTNGIGNWRAARTSDLRSWQHYYRTLAAKTNLFPVAPQPQTPAQDVLLALSKYDSAIKKLREASRRPYSRFPLDYDYENPSEILLPHLSDLRGCAQVLQLRALAELENGQRDRAFDDVKLALYLVNSIHSEPFIISQLVRFAIFQIALQPIYEGLAGRKWSDAQLAELETQLSGFDFLAGYQWSVRGERAAHIKVINYLEQKRSRFDEVFDWLGSEYNSQQNSMNKWFIFATAYLGPKGWFYQNDRVMAQILQYWDLPVVNDERQTVSPEKAVLADESIASLNQPTPFNFLAQLLTPSLGPFARKAAYGQNAVNLARVAIALERYRLAHGNYPESLGVLVPQFMKKIPHDIMNGQPLHYRRTADGQFVLYSVGWNETDDGGAVVLNKDSSDRVDITKGDWVWRYPAG